MTETASVCEEYDLSIDDDAGRVALADPWPQKAQAEELEGKPMHFM